MSKIEVKKTLAPGCDHPQSEGDYICDGDAFTIILFRPVKLCKVHLIELRNKIIKALSE